MNRVFGKFVGCCRCASRKECPTSPSDGCALKVRRHYPIKTLERDAPQRCPTVGVGFGQQNVCVCVCACVDMYVSLLTIHHPPYHPSHHPHDPPNLLPSSISVGSVGSCSGMWFGGHPAMGISFTGDSSDGGRVRRIHPHKQTQP